MTTRTTHKAVTAVVDYGGLAVFAVGYLVTRDLIAATWWLVAGSAVALAIGFAAERRVAPMPLLAGGAALLFGALTLIFKDAVWVAFRFPGLLILALVFSITQVPFMMKYMKEPEAPPPPTD